MKVTMLMFWFYVTLINVTKFVKTVDLQKWKDFKIQFAKHYATPKEEKRRKNIFEENLHIINNHNKKYKKGKVSYEMGMNHFGDMTEEEFDQIQGDNSTVDEDFGEMLKYRKESSIITSLSGTAPEFKNWINEGAVTPVKNQLKPKRCGSCWAFAVAGAIESHNFIHTGKLVALSEQNLLDCVGQHFKRPNKDSCKGGSPERAIQYVVENQGIATEESYPYTGKQALCRYNDENKGATIVDYKILRQGDEELMKSAVGLIGPVTASIYSHKQMRFHKKGIYKNPECLNTKKHHAVLVVGYGTEENEAYWLVKNSWGSNWGDGGYFKMRRGTNECKLTRSNLYPVF